MKRRSRNDYRKFLGKNGFGRFFEERKKKLLIFAAFSLIFTVAMLIILNSPPMETEDNDSRA
ncbi:MAG: hypothetical protein ACP6IY_21275, partial [Promethearchaeia archaeon]